MDQAAAILSYKYRINPIKPPVSCENCKILTGYNYNWKIPKDFSLYVFVSLSHHFRNIVCDCLQSE